MTFHLCIASGHGITTIDISTNIGHDNVFFFLCFMHQAFSDRSFALLMI